MTDQELRQKRFDYVSYQVIPRDPSLIQNEPSGESESLKGKITEWKMGERAQKEKPTKLKEKVEEQKKKKKKKISLVDTKKITKIKFDPNSNVLHTNIEDHNLYKPKTKENRILYEQILQLVAKALTSKYGDVPQDQLKSVNNEVLAILKTDNMKDKDKQTEIEILIGGTNESFDQMLNFAKQITDFHADNEQNVVGVEDREANVYAEDESSEDEDQDNIDEFLQQFYLIIRQSEEEEENANGNDQDNDENLERIRRTGGIEIEGENDDKNEVDIKYFNYFYDQSELEAFWLQSKINSYFHDPQQAKKLEYDVLQILNSNEDNECEKQLLWLLGQDKFNLIQLLTKNRHKIYYCTLLNQAQDKQEKLKIKLLMKSTEVGQNILDLIENQGQVRQKQSNTIEKMKKEAFTIAKADKIVQEEAEQQIFGVNNITDEEFNRIGKKILDFDKLTFQQGSHFMSNEKCKLPNDSYRVSKQGYDEVYVNATQTKSQTTNLVKIESLPSWAQKAFSNIKALNVIQSKVFDTAFNTPENMLVCAPTGAGKTNVALLTMLQVIGNYIKPDGQIDLKKFKIVYIAPMKALVSELVGNFSNRLQPYNIKVKELTGDMQLTKQQIEETQLIVATPEKWDIITRKSGDKVYTELVKLLIIDEIHLLHDSRGPVLEALVARTIRNIEQTQQMVRIVGLSATLPNYVDVATFIRVKAKKGLFYFDSTYRPVPLEQQYIGITEKKAVRKMMLMNEILYEKVIERGGKYPMIVFVHSRRDTVKTAQALKEMAYSKDELQKLLPEESDSKKILTAVLEKEKIYSQDLKELLPFGFAIHHAGLSRLDRDLVEHLFADKHIQVLVSTSTLAWGVNLPAHTVIIKGTQIYSPEQGRWTELSPQDVLQMMGRAGRPNYDTKGEGIIITSYQELKYYLSLLNQQLPIESQFIFSLADQLNAEIVLGTVNNVKEGVNWLGYTYLYLRMMRSPGTYCISQQEIDEDPLLLKRRIDLIHTAASILDKHNLIKYDKKTGLFQVTSLGKIASHYYIKYPSIQTYNENLKSNMCMIELLRVFSLSNEFKFIPIREEEKSELAKLIETVPVPIKGSPDDSSTKINILLQAYIGRLPLEGYALNADMVYVTQSAGRIMRAIFEICLKRGWAQVTETAHNLCKMIDKRMWICMTFLRQFKGIPEEILRRIERKEQFTYDNFYNMTPQLIGDLVKVPRLGKILHKYVHQFPKLDLLPYIQPITRSCLKIDLTIKVDFEWDEKVHGTSEPFWIFVYDCNCEDILYSQFINIKAKYATVKDYVYQFTVPLFENLHPLYYIKVVSDRWIQSETILPVSFKTLILPEKFSSPTELYDLQLLPVSALEWKEAENMFKSIGIKQFNSIQTQVFQNFYIQKENIFLGAPTGSGKTACILLAILRVFKENIGGKIIYITPYEQMAALIYNEWNILFQNFFGKKVQILTGQINMDTQLLDQNDVIISNPENFDILSRRWKTRKSFAKINLYIIDELHLLQENTVIEVITSRMRQISSQMEKNIQIIGCATSLADYREISVWLGAQPKQTFNFHPNVRPYPLDIIVSGFEQIHLQNRLIAMKKQMYQAIKQFAAEDQKQVIVFVSDRKQARITALDLMTFASSDNQPKKFLKITDGEMSEFIAQVNDHYLQVVLEVGIGFLYEGMKEDERKIVEELYAAGAIQVLISTYILSWELNIHAFLVMILDNQRYDGSEKRYIDYTIPDMLQMIGRAKDSQNLGGAAKCIVMCQAPKKNFYKKFLFEPFPIESSLNQNLSDNICSEIVVKTITSKQDCVDWITWTFMYWRLNQNPSFYKLQDVSATAINDYLSELIESTIDELVEMKCIAVEGEQELIPLNFGRIANFFYISNQTIQLFAENIKEESKLKHLIEIISNASEFDKIPIRQGEDPLLRELCESIEYKIDKPDYNEPSTKTNILLQYHFNRTQLSSDFIYDQKFILQHSIRLCHAMIEVISSNGWLQQDIKMMQLCQMIVQAQWANQSPLLQLPYFDQELVQNLKKYKVEDISDFLDMNDDDRNLVLSHLSQSQIEEIANFTNKYPSISIQWQVQNENELYEEEITEISILLEREGDDVYDSVSAPYYPNIKEELWWILIGDKKLNKILSIKRMNIKKTEKFNLKFETPSAGTHELSVYLICDSYIGCDQVFHIFTHTKQVEQIQINTIPKRNEVEEIDQV